SYAFAECSSLTSLIIPEGVECIDGMTFVNCSSLTSITIPYSVTSIGGDAFGQCFNLVNVYYSGTEEQWNEIVIYSGNEFLLDANIIYV
ncbi:MAG: leucine-rich repeat protein, partial [Bacilli bacterium]